MSETTHYSINLEIVLFIVFLILKLTNVIAWSWWWVTCPLWIGPAILIAGLIIVAAVTSITELFN